MLTPDAQHFKVFSEVPIIGFKRGKSLKDLLVRAKVLVEKETDEKSCGCQGKCCKVCTFLEEKNTFTNKDGSDTHKIREGLKKKTNFMAPFYGWGSTASRLEPLRGGSLLFTTKFPDIPGTHFSDLGRMKG